jgi:hypothetical protein
MVAESNHPTEDETDRRITRRGLIRGGAAVAGVGLVGGVGLWHGSQPALAVELGEHNWSADDAEITTHDGTITAVNIKPTLDVKWEGFNRTEEDDLGEDLETDLDIEIEVDFPEAEEEDNGLIGGLLGILVADSDDLPVTMYDETKQLEGTNGQKEIILEEKDLTDEDEINEEGFGAENGETNETIVELSLTATPDMDDVEPVEDSTEFTVTVTNLESNYGTDGTVETSVESDEEVEDD